MPIDIGLTRAQTKAYYALLRTHHSVYIRVQVLDKNHNYISDISNRLFDGQVTVDANGSVTRAAEVILLDPGNALHMDSKSPDDGALFADRMLRVYHITMAPDGTASYACPIFTGPVTRFERTGPVVSVECQGKEIAGLKPSWGEKTFKKGSRVTSVIRQILRDLMGEVRIDIPTRSEKTSRNVTIAPDKPAWIEAKKLARSIGFQLFYDGRGVAKMRKIPSQTCFVFRDDETIKTEPILGFNLDKLVNSVEVKGKKPKKGKDNQRPKFRLVADKKHPLSPASLGTSLRGDYYPLYIEDDNIKTKAQARERCEKELRIGLIESVEVAYDTLVQPDLQELDVVRCSTHVFSEVHRLRQFAIPFGVGGVMSVGYVKNVKPRSIRRPRRSRAATKSSSVKGSRA